MYYGEVVKLIKQYGLEDRIILTGYRKDIPPLMKLMHVIVHASIQPEPFGRVIIEGVAIGKPVVATAAGGPIDIVRDGVTGILVNPGDILQMADSIISLLTDTHLLKKMGENGRRRVEKIFTKERYAAQVIEIYDHLLAKPQ